MNQLGLIPQIDENKEKLTQIGREIYYAVSNIQAGLNPLANLDLALSYLGITHPNDVGLSVSIDSRLKSPQKS